MGGYVDNSAYIIGGFGTIINKMDGIPESHTGRNVTVTIVVALVIAAAGFLYYWYLVRTSALPRGAPLSQETPSVPAEAAPADLGSKLYEKAANPVAGELPETLAPVPNPVEGIYKNPFE
jgi:hypothetical protein